MGIECSGSADQLRKGVLNVKGSIPVGICDACGNMKQGIEADIIGGAEGIRCKG